jgi:FAD/FMN-containing dehydrogenase
MTRTEAIVALVKDHTYGRHARSHPDCPVCARREDAVSPWVRRAQDGRLPTRITGGTSW